jgi:uncharacterized protein YodC (DUF2158 family)
MPRETPREEPRQPLGVAGTDLRKGDVVFLKSGGPPMTVVGQVDEDIRCQWFIKDGDDFYEIQGASFPRAALDTQKE